VAFAQSMIVFFHHTGIPAVSGGGSFPRYRHWLGVLRETPNRSAMSAKPTV
jgi:hypothetical protein